MDSSLDNCVSQPSFGGSAPMAVAADAPAPAPAPTTAAVVECPRLTLEQAVAMALQRQPAVIAARASRNAAIARREAAYSRFAKLAGIQIHVRRKQADIGVAIAQAGLDQAELDTTNAVTRTYLTAIYAGEQVKVATDSADRFRALHKVAEEMVKGGTSRDVTTSDAERIGTYRLLAESRQAEAFRGVARARPPCGKPSAFLATTASTSATIN